MCVTDVDKLSGSLTSLARFSSACLPACMWGIYISISKYLRAVIGAFVGGERVERSAVAHMRSLKLISTYKGNVCEIALTVRTV